MAISVKLQAFEGPLDLLLHLIDKNKIDIYDIPIAEITEQYLEYVKSMETKDLNIMSEFLVMAATLINIKSKMLLPKEIIDDKEEEDPREELVKRLLEYKMYKLVSFELKDKQVDAEKLLYKKPTIPKEVSGYKQEVDLSQLLSGLTLSKLNTIFESVMKRQVDKIDPIRSKFGRIEKEEVNLSEMMSYIEKYIGLHKIFSFKKLIENQIGKMEMIVTFLCVLELMKTGKINIQQNDLFDDILISATI